MKKLFLSLLAAVVVLVFVMPGPRRILGNLHYAHYHKLMIRQIEWNDDLAKVSRHWGKFNGEIHDFFVDDSSIYITGIVAEHVQTIKINLATEKIVWTVSYHPNLWRPRDPNREWFSKSTMAKLVVDRYNCFTVVRYTREIVPFHKAGIEQTFTTEFRREKSAR